MNEHHLTVQRTARYHTLGPDDGSARDVWFVLHGQGQLAARFLRHFAALDDGTRLVVAPEALSRYYTDAPARAGGEPPRVGAIWMTREDRESEINDYVGYLDALAARVFARVPREDARVTVLGFSQGAATATRWVTHGTTGADHLVCWGAALAHDVPLGAENRALHAARLALVAGADGEDAAPAAVAAEEGRLRAHGVRYERLSFDGGHHLDRETLLALAARRRRRSPPSSRAPRATPGARWYGRSRSAA